MKSLLTGAIQVIASTITVTLFLLLCYKLRAYFSVSDTTYSSFTHTLAGWFGCTVFFILGKYQGQYD